MIDRSMARTRQIRAARMRSAQVLLVAPWLLAVAACGGGDDTLVLGARAPRPYRFGAPSVVRELSIEGKADNPSLTADLLEIYFTAAASATSQSADIWSATRSDARDAFGEPQRVDAVNSSGVETSPVVSADGLTLWFASDRPGGHGDLDIWVCSRSARGDAWSEPANVGPLNSAGKEIPRPPGQRQRVMPLASDRDDPGYYRIYFSARAAIDAAFERPEDVAELVFADQSTVDGFLTDDGLSLFYVTGPEFGPADLYVASRRSVGDPFEHAVALDALNTARDERDPWLSADGSLFYFSSDRSGRYEIYVARARREAVTVDP
jgi:Tol biopolymer transport system component